ncbi:hypothetical protein BACCIP111883_00155 [Sutcliffiella rhizosphaerae]|uniref:Uncharacterized protein n=1 Tax=Sutcliffiella rhizosphaerae TaxID=2880967 RepID=A0ABM8YHL4_9BACI|nr:hypothetical protein BACCIP111883_00155 [Sutcliffiella rhizosphaerae]
MVVLKTFITGMLVILFLAGCSDAESTINMENEEAATVLLNEQIEGLEKEIDEQSKTLAETEKELKELKQVNSDEEFIMIPKETASRWRDNLDVQLWEMVTDFSMSYENGFERGETNWREWDGEIGEPFMTINENWETPGQLLSNWINYHDLSYWNGMDLFEVNMRIDYDSENEEAIGYVLTYGYKDDSIAGDIKKVMMKLEDNSWYIEDVFIRNQCHRNVSEDGELCV